MAIQRVVADAPGRVNLIGEHTDYNDGFVLPMALPFATEVELKPLDGRRVVAHSAGHDAIAFDLDEDPRSAPSWGKYLAGMAHLLAEAGVAVTGFEASVRTDIPVGASLSSSAALEVATGFGLCALVGEDPDAVAIAKLGQRVENEVIGIQSGIMDQLIVATAVEGAATLIDCRTLEGTPVQIPGSATAVIMDTMTRRELVDSEYDLRRQACEAAAEAIGVTALRDATVEQTLALDDVVRRRRAHHVVTENARVEKVVAAFKADDLATVGALMNESHESLQGDYEVSSPALDQMSEIAREHPGCFGARMTGGGFAGSAVALVDRAEAPGFVSHIERVWEREHGVIPDVWAVDPSRGAAVTNLSFEF